MPCSTLFEPALCKQFRHTACKTRQDIGEFEHISLTVGPGKSIGGVGDDFVRARVDRPYERRAGGEEVADFSSNVVRCLAWRDDFDGEIWREIPKTLWNATGRKPVRVYVRYIGTTHRIRIAAQNISRFYADIASRGTLDPHT